MRIVTTLATAFVFALMLPGAALAEEGASGGVDSLFADGITKGSLRLLIHLVLLLIAYLIIRAIERPFLESPDSGTKIAGAILAAGFIIGSAILIAASFSTLAMG
ncbi:MAG: hypothetical protein NUW37_09325 [Planctomycetes bacterium]|nr:hypothetical protein [Planctomycetota bacterium]